MSQSFPNKKEIQTENSIDFVSNQNIDNKNKPFSFKTSRQNSIIISSTEDRSYLPGIDSMI